MIRVYCRTQLARSVKRGVTATQQAAKKKRKRTCSTCDQSVPRVIAAGGEALLGRPSTSDSDRCGTRRRRSPPVASAAPGAPAHLPHQPHGAHSHGDRSSSAERAQREQDRKSKEEKEKARLSYLRTLYRPIRTGEKEPPYFRAGQRSAKGSTGTFSGPPRGCVAAARSRASIAAPNDACGCSRAVLGAAPTGETAPHLPTTTAAKSSSRPMNRIPTGTTGELFSCFCLVCLFLDPLSRARASR